MTQARRRAIGVAFVISLFCTSLSEPIYAVEGKPLNYGHRYEFPSKVLDADREILISVPSSYAENPSSRYPVLYVLNGESQFLHTVATTQFLTNTAHSIPNLIVVGVTHPDSGTDLRPNAPSSGQPNPSEQQFRRFLVEELIPYVDQSYRTEPYRILVGNSLSGLFVLNTLRATPNSFAAYFAISPALWWDDGKEARAIQSWMTRTKLDRMALVMTMANEGSDSTEPYSALIATLTTAPDLPFDFFHHEFPQETHDSTTLPAVYWSLQTLFSNWNPGIDVLRQGLPGLETHYTELSSRFGWTVPIPKDTVSSLVFDFARRNLSGDAEKVRDLIDYALTQDPKQVSEYEELVAALRMQDQADAADLVQRILCDNQLDLFVCRSN